MTFKEAQKIIQKSKLQLISAFSDLEDKATPDMKEENKENREYTESTYSEEDFAEADPPSGKSEKESDDDFSCQTS